MASVASLEDAIRVGFHEKISGGAFGACRELVNLTVDPGDGLEKARAANIEELAGSEAISSVFLSEAELV
eukprot:13154146-Alexandrium_andersonii.AAC.1